MADKQKKKRGWFRWLGRIFIILVISLIVLAVAGRYLIIPGVIRSQIDSNVQKYWQGEARIGEIEFNLFSNPYLREITLLDEQGRPWAKIDEVEIALRNWPSLNPVLHALEIEKPELLAYFDDGECNPPTKTPPKGTGRFAKYIDLREITVHDGCFTTVDDEGPKFSWGKFQISAVRKKQQEDFEVLLRQTDSDDNIMIGATVNPKSFEGTAKISLEYTANQAEMSAVLSNHDVPVVGKAEGLIDLNVKLTGKFSEPTKLHYSGTVNFIDWKLLADEGLVAKDVDISIKLNGQKGKVLGASFAAAPVKANLAAAPFSIDSNAGFVSLNVETFDLHFSDTEDYGPFWSKVFRDAKTKGSAQANGNVHIPIKQGRKLSYDLAANLNLARITLPTATPLEISNVRSGKFYINQDKVDIQGIAGETCGGRLEARYLAEKQIDNTTRHWGKVSVSDVFMPEFTAALAGKESMKRGIGDCDFEFAATSGSREELRGKGFIFLDDCDLMAIPIIDQIYTAMHAIDRKLIGTSDMESLFTLNWPVVKLKEARAGNQVSALEAEPGGTIDLKSSEVDLYVVGIPLKQVRQLLQSIPVIRLFVNLKDKLTRVHVTGKWSKPRIIKEPVKDVTQGTTDFAVDMVNTGGQFGQGMIDATGGLLQQMEMNGKNQKPKPQSKQR